MTGLLEEWVFILRRIKLQGRCVFFFFFWGGGLIKDVGLGASTSATVLGFSVLALIGNYVRETRPLGKHGLPETATPTPYINPKP